MSVASVAIDSVLRGLSYQGEGEKRMEGIADARGSAKSRGPCTAANDGRQGHTRRQRPSSRLPRLRSFFSFLDQLTNQRSSISMRTKLTPAPSGDTSTIPVAVAVSKEKPKVPKKDKDKCKSKKGAKSTAIKSRAPSIWTADEKKTILRIVSKRGASIKHFEGALPGRSGLACYVRWR